MHPRSPHLPYGTRECEPSVDVVLRKDDVYPIRIILIYGGALDIMKSEIGCISQQLDTLTFQLCCVRKVQVLA